MTKRQGKSGTIDIKAVLAEDEEFLRALVRMALQEVLETEMTEALGAEKGEQQNLAISQVNTPPADMKSLRKVGKKLGSTADSKHPIG